MIGSVPTSMFIADAMLRIGRPATAREIHEKLNEIYPHVTIELPVVRARIAALHHSANCLMIQTEREKGKRMTYHLRAIDRSFFRNRRGIEKTCIPERSQGNKDEWLRQYARNLWDAMIRKRIPRQLVEDKPRTPLTWQGWLNVEAMAERIAAVMQRKRHTRPDWIRARNAFVKG